MGKSTISMVMFNSKLLNYQCLVVSHESKMWHEFNFAGLWQHLSKTISPCFDKQKPFLLADSTSLLIKSGEISSNHHSSPRKSRKKIPLSWNPVENPVFTGFFAAFFRSLREATSQKIPTCPSSKVDIIESRRPVKPRGKAKTTAWILTNDFKLGSWCMCHVHVHICIYTCIPIYIHIHTSYVLYKCICIYVNMRVCTVRVHNDTYICGTSMETVCLPYVVSNDGETPGRLTNPTAKIHGNCTLNGGDGSKPLGTPLMVA